MPNRTSWRIRRCSRVRRSRATSARGCSSTGRARHAWRLDAQEVLTGFSQPSAALDAVGTVRKVVVRVQPDLRESGAIRTLADHVDILDPIRLSEEQSGTWCLSGSERCPHTVGHDHDNGFRHVPSSRGQCGGGRRAAFRPGRRRVRPGRRGIRGTPQGVERVDRPASRHHRPLHRSERHPHRAPLRSRRRAADRDARRRPQLSRAVDMRRWPAHRPSPDERRPGRSRRSGGRRPGRCAARGARRGDPGARPRRPGRHRVAHRAGWPDPGRWDRLDHAQVRLDGGFAPVGRPGDRGRGARADRRGRERRLVLGAARRGRQFRRRH